MCVELVLHGPLVSLVDLVLWRITVGRKVCLLLLATTTVGLAFFLRSNILVLVGGMYYLNKSQIEQLLNSEYFNSDSTAPANCSASGMSGRVTSDY